MTEAVSTKYRVLASYINVYAQLHAVGTKDESAILVFYVSY